MKRTLKVPYLSSRSSYLTAVGKLTAVVLGAVVLFGCPIYSGPSGDVVCDNQGNCCDESSGNCYIANCDTSEQCPLGATCSPQLVCVGPSYDGGGYYNEGDGGDGGSDAGTTGDATTDCSSTGCQSGFTCTVIGGTASCQANADGGGSGQPDGGMVKHDSSATADAGVDAPLLPPFTGCSSDSACADAGAGARCLDGVCVAAANTCFDSTQCPFVGTSQEECVQGVCTPACGNGAACPAGYSCDATTSVCTGNPTPCGAAGDGSTCATGTTCVDEHCVPDCTSGAGDSSAEAGPSCSGLGIICVDHGCIPDQSPIFVCAGADGTRSTCAASSNSICLHHNCYISCTLDDAGADAGNSCQQADNFNVCKAVTTSTGSTVDVCGSSTNLGNQCDPTQGQNCMSPAICIDGYCR